LGQAARGEAPLAEVIAGFLEAWRREILPHFRAEEEVLLPDFARAVAPDHPLIVRTLTEHVALRRAVRDLERARGEQRTGAALISQILHDHIRFEERLLFPAIENTLAGEELEELGRRLAGEEE